MADQHTMTRREAIATVRRMRKGGWGQARITPAGNEIDGYSDTRYYVTTHGRGCKCGMCPTLRINGEVR
jgi:hypothetical protein